MTRRATIVLACCSIVGAVVIAAVIVFLARGSDSPAPAGTDAGIAIDPSATDPVGVATAVMSAVYTWQPAVQASPWEALHGQQAHLTGPMATAATARFDPQPQPMSEWSAWSRGGDIVSAVTTVDGEPSTGTDKTTVPVAISQTVQHTSGEITPYTTYTATVDLEHTDDGWKVANYRLDNVTR